MAMPPDPLQAPHLLVVDDDQRLCDLLRRYLASNGFVVSTADSAAAARAKLQALKFDLIVLDIMMPGENGLDFTAALRRESTIPILLLSARGSPNDRIDGLETGADDYLAKPFEPRELLLRVHAILRRLAKPEAPLPEIQLGALSFRPDRGELRRGDTIIPLTTAEAGLLRALAAAPGVTLTREQLSSRSGLAANPRTIDVQVNRLRRKIEPDPRTPRYLQTVRGEGYVLWPD